MKFSFQQYTGRSGGVLCILKKAVVLSFVLLLFSCGQGNNKNENIVQDTLAYKDPLMNVNQDLVKKESAQIDDYIARYQWDMQKSGTGLRYNIYKKGSGAAAVKEARATIRFTVNLINGTVVYDSKKDGLKSFELGKAEVESGLEEGIMMMHVGDRAKLIIPSHLAFGLLGDEDKIPKRATLIYDVELISIDGK